MAVWIYAYGNNGLLPGTDIDSQRNLEVLNSVPLDETTFLDTVKRHSLPGELARKYYSEHREQTERWLRSISEEEYNAYLDSIRFPRIEKANLVDYFIIDAERRDREDDLRFDAAYQLSKDKQSRSGWEGEGKQSFINRIHQFSPSPNGLRVNLINDLVRVTGPFEIFSHFGGFLYDTPVAVKEFYHTCFKNLLKAFRSDFILYTHEWAGLDDEDNEKFDLAELKEASNWEETSSDSLYTMKDFYFEQL